MTREQYQGTSRSEARTQPNIVRHAARTVERAVRAGAQSYERGRDLPGLIRFRFQNHPRRRKPWRPSSLGWSGLSGQSGTGPGQATGRMT